MPRSTVLVDFALALPLALLVAAVIAWLVRRIFGARLSLPFAVRCPRAAEPVFLTQGGSTELWVRVGNSTRALGVDEAVSYVARRFSPSFADVVLGRR